MSHKWNHNFPKIAREAGFSIRELSVGHCIDWRFIASIDPYSIVSDRDYEKLDEFIPHISEVPIGTVLNNRILDPAIGKYFVLAQFSIQYLLFCKQFLDETVMEIRNTAQDVQKENARLEKLCRKKSEEMVSLHRKLQRAENTHQTQHVVYPCSKCTKNFISAELLSAHMARKHSDVVVTSGECNSAGGRKLSETDTNLINTIKLELEVKQLKERLNATEKDLMDQRSRERHCHICEDSRTKERDKGESPKLEVEHRSVAIQSNLEDAKDVNEKEVQTSIRSKTPETPPRLSPIPRFTPSPIMPMMPPADYISKSDLESLVREQKAQFESWKSSEREKFNSEIEQVRQNLAEAIRELEQREVPPPPPPVARIEEHHRVEDDNSIWRQRYHELEQMYESSQRQVRETVENVEAVYEEKFRQFERLMERREAMAVRERSESLQRVDRLTVPKSSKIPILESAKLPVISKDEREESEIDEAIEHDSNSEDVQTESDEEIRALEAAKARFLARANSPSRVLEEQKELPAKSEKPLISPKKQILNTFKSRLKALGIDPKAKLLPKEDLNTAAVALAERRDVNKKKNKTFFITRNQLLAKVDQIAKGKMGESALKVKSAHRPKPEEQPVIKKRDSAAQPIPKIRSSKTPTLDILPSKLKLPTEDRLLTVPQQSQIAKPNLFKVKSAATTSSASQLLVPEVHVSNDIITVQAEINTVEEALSRSPIPPRGSSSSFADYDQHRLEQLLDTPIKKVGTPPDLIAGARGENESDLSDFLDSHTKPVPKKRVLFNLDKEKTSSAGKERKAGLEVGSGSSKHLAPTLSSTVIHVSKADEESDWNISSFEDEK